MSNQKPLSGNLLDYGDWSTDGLVGLWLLNEGSGKKVFDLSGNGNTGTLVADTHWVPGKFGPALDFDGTGDQVTVPALDEIRLNKDFTIVFAGTAGERGDMIFSQTVSSNERFEIHLLDSGLPNLMSAFYDGVAGNGYECTVEVAEYSYHHFAVVRFSDKTAKLYTDGIEGTTSGGWMAPSSGATDLLIGRAGYLGRLEYVMVYNRALSASEVALLYREPFRMIRTRRRRIGLVSEDVGVAAVYHGRGIYRGVMRGMVA